MKTFPGKRRIFVIAGSFLLLTAFYVLSPLLWTPSSNNEGEAVPEGSRMRTQSKTNHREYGDVPNGVSIGAIDPAFTQDLGQQKNGSGKAIESGMTPAEVLATIGKPKRQSASIMKSGIYGVPSTVEQEIGHGIPFEMWDYEQSSPERSIYTTVWLSPKLPEKPAELSVIAVKRQVVRRSLKFRILNKVDGVLQKMGIDLD